MFTDGNRTCLSNPASQIRKDIDANARKRIDQLNEELWNTRSNDVVMRYEEVFDDRCPNDLNRGCDQIKIGHMVAPALAAARGQPQLNCNAAGDCDVISLQMTHEAIEASG